MGIQGLLPFLKKIHQPVNVSQFAGCTVAIDAYCWLHKGAFSCAEKLALGEKTDQYVYYCMKFINYLLSKNIKPVMVFDGGHLPSKKSVEKARREKRDLNRKKAAQFLREGKRAEARECLQRCIDISPEMALELMNACRDRGVDCIVAPYEADAQLAYLNKIGIAQVIITEDSDLLLFGCEKVLFKMDHSGNGVLIEQRRLNEVLEIQTDTYTFDKFRYLCILSGCDYLASLSGIGLAKANKVFKIARQSDIEQLLKKLSTYLKSNITVPQEYIDGFVAANNTFLYQLVFDPLKRKLVPLTPYAPDVDPSCLHYAGAYMSDNRALQVALGNINIYTGDKFADFDPDTFVAKYNKKKPEMLHLHSIWSRGYRVKPRAALHDVQMPDRPILLGKEIAVKASLRRSPRKRVREAEDGEDVRSDTELSSLYGDVSPATKKTRSEDIDDDLHRFMFAAADETGEPSSIEEDVEEKEEELITATVKVKPNPEFFNSLSEAHPELLTTSPRKRCTSLPEENKENGIKSPTRNIFALKSPDKKYRFNLNASKPKEVKSRFFAAGDKNQVQKNLGDYRPVHSKPLNEGSDTAVSISSNPFTSPRKSTKQEQSMSASGKKSAKSPAKPFKFSKHSPSSSTKGSPASNSAFSWSSFKFNRQNSHESLESSPSVSKPFKKVVSKTDNSTGSESTHNLNSSHSIDELQSLSDTGSIGEHQNPELGDSGQSMDPAKDSYPYSIDSMGGCSQIQSELGSQKSLPSLPSLSQDCDMDSNNSSEDAATDRKERTLNKFFTPLSQSIGDVNVNGRHTNWPLSQSTNVQGSQISSTANSESPGSRVVFVIESDEEEDTQSEKSGFNSKKTAQKALKPEAVKPGCRVSGLSRKSRKSSSTGALNSKDQPKLRDMFAKFAHSTKPKLIHDS
ncbi:exonuclease 1-like isoform X2 [Dreissena polymorpha]|uniref:exonuclease 1-like isoform X2 n=1 Tax=Dreissena polymorpha TaxID=45954 RepID=UPI002264E9D3|nr:exonuclease 1-like isoform X2 [Dreissena polymorpha]